MYPPGLKFLLAGVAAFFATPLLLQGQTVVNSTFVNSGTSLYSDPNNWSPAEVPSNTAARHYNVSIGEGSWVHEDIDATVSNLALSGYIYIFDSNLLVEGTTALDPAPLYGGTAIVANGAPASLNAGALSAFSGGTLRGNYALFGQGNTATLQFDGANVNVLSDSRFTLYGPSVRVIDENGNNAFGNLARVESSATLTLAGNTLTTSAPFTNLGEIALGDGSDATLFEAVASLGNFDSTTRTTSGGIFRIGFRDSYGQGSVLTEFRFAGADIVNNGSGIHLAGPLSRIVDPAGNDGLRNLAHNLATGFLTFHDHDFTTIGSFRNDGSLTLRGSTFTMLGSLDNFEAATGTLSGGIYSLTEGAILKFNGADIRRNEASLFVQQSQITDLAGNDALRNFHENLGGGSFTVGNGHLFTGSGDFTNAGRIEIARASFGIHETWAAGEFRLPAAATYTQTAGITINGGTFAAGSINIAGGTFQGAGAIKGNLSVTNATIVPGGTIDGNLTLGADAHVHTTIALYSADRWDRITGAASLAGTLKVELSGEAFLSSYDTIYLLQSTGAVSGTFSNAPHGARITTVDGSGSFVVLYEPNQVKLTDFHALPPPAQLLNISTRAFLSREDDDPFGSRRVLIGGFIISGAESKKVVVRGLGPSLAKVGLSPTLADPTMELHGSDGATIATNDDWADSQGSEMNTNGLAPGDPREAAIIATLDPGVYTVVIREKDGLGGHGLVEVYDLASSSNSKLGNISTRGFTDDANVLIGGIIVAGEGQANAQIVVRALGPQLRRHGIFNALEDPTLEVRDANGGVVAFNDDWFVNYEGIPTQLYPHDSRESAIRLSLPRGNYTALVRAKANSGVGLVEFYDLRR